jgi:hypothetical protein
VSAVSYKLVNYAAVKPVLVSTVVSSPFQVPPTNMRMLVMSVKGYARQIVETRSASDVTCPIKNVQSVGEIT